MFPSHDPRGVDQKGRDYDKAAKMIGRLNKHGEYAPYKMIKI
jgi:hypothetical protein